MKHAWGQQRLGLQILLDSGMNKNPSLKEADANVKTEKYLLRSAMNHERSARHFAGDDRRLMKRPHKAAQAAMRCGISS